MNVVHARHQDFLSPSLVVHVGPESCHDGAGPATRSGEHADGGGLVGGVPGNCVKIDQSLLALVIAYEAAQLTGDWGDLDDEVLDGKTLLQFDASRIQAVVTWRHFPCQSDAGALHLGNVEDGGRRGRLWKRIKSK